MPSVYDLKPRFQALLRPLVGRLAAAGITANQVTLAALALSVAVGLLVFLLAPHRLVLLLLPAALFARMALNAIDGMLAREHGQASRLGALLNEAGDVLSDLALYLPLATALAHLGAHGLAVALFAGLAVATEAAGLAALQIGSPRRYEGPMGKSDRAALVGALGFVLALGLPGGSWLTLLFLAASALEVATIVNRGRAALAAQGPQRA